MRTSPRSAGPSAGPRRPRLRPRLRLRGGRRWSLVRTRREALTTSLRRRLRLGPGVASTRGVVVAALVVVVLGALASVGLATPALGVRTVEVRGTALVSADLVRAKAAIGSGTPLARVDPGEVARRVSTLPAVAHVSVHRAWPHTLIIEVTERVGVAVVPSLGRFLVLDAEGVVFLTATRRPDGLVLLRVAHPGPDDPATRAALRVVASLTPALRAQLTRLAADSPVALRLELRDGRVVIWGDAEQSEVKALVATSLLSRPGNRIDVSEPTVATVS